MKTAIDYAMDAVRLILMFKLFYIALAFKPSKPVHVFNLLLKQFIPSLYNLVVLRVGEHIFKLKTTCNRGGNLESGSRHLNFVIN